MNKDAIINKIEQMDEIVYALTQRPVRLLDVVGTLMTLSDELNELIDHVENNLVDKPSSTETQDDNSPSQP